MSPVYAMEINTLDHVNELCSKDNHYLISSQRMNLMDKRTIYLSEIREIESFKNDWDGEGGVRILENVIKLSKKVINSSSAEHLYCLSEDDIIPYSNGTLSLHYKKKGTELVFFLGDDKSRIKIKNISGVKYIDNAVLNQSNISSFLNENLV